MSRKVCVTAVDGQTGFLIAELLLTSTEFSKKVDSVVGLTLDPQSDRAKELKSLGAQIVHHESGHEKKMVDALKKAGCDVICLVPPAHKKKYDITIELISVAKKAEIPNVCFVSAAGCDFADARRQPRLREFIELESAAMATKGDTSTPTGHSPIIIRAGFYAENLLLYAPQAQNEGTLPLPIGTDHKFAPVALGDIAHLIAHVLTGRGEHGFDDRHRGQMMVMTGPLLCAGEELATSASKGIGVKMEFEAISEEEAKKVLSAQSESDESEKEYILEYYSLVREGKTNYISTTAYHDVTGQHPTEPDEFFKLYSDEMRPRKKAKRGHK